MDIIQQEEKWAIKPQKHMGEPKMHLGKENKWVWKGYILCNPNDTAVCKKQTYKEHKKINVCQGSEVREEYNDGSLGTLNLFNIVMTDTWR